MIKLYINNKEYKYFTGLSVDLNYTGFVSTFQFNAPFDSESDDHKVLFKPLSYNEVKIYFNDRLVLTGPIVSNNFEDESKPTNTTFSGYSKSGILQDVNIPVSLYPIESKDRTLKEIIERLIKPFGIKLSFKATDKKYEKTVASEGDTIGDYIHKLCDQRNLRLSHDVNGNLLVSEIKQKNNQIKTTFNNDFKANKANLYVDGQSIFSEYIGLKQTSIKNNVQAESVKKFPIAYRPKVNVQQDGAQGDIEAFTKSMRAAGGRALSLTLNLDRWTNYADEIYLPGDVVNYQNNELFLYKLNRWFIESVSLREENKQELATLNLVPDWVIYDVEPVNPFE